MGGSAPECGMGTVSGQNICAERSRGVNVANGVTADFGALPIWSGWLGAVRFGTFWKPLERFVKSARPDIGVGSAFRIFVLSSKTE